MIHFFYHRLPLYSATALAVKVSECGKAAGEESESEKLTAKGARSAN